jgi:multidrug efflux system membrane fusion protein
VTAVPVNASPEEEFMLPDSVFARLSGVMALAMMLAACSHHEAPVEIIRPVQLLQVKVGAAGEQAVYAGEVKPRHEADLGFRIGGKMVARAVDVGATVKAGEVLARLDPADVGLQAEAAKAQLAAAETEASFAKAELDRYQGLLDQKFISQSALDAKRNAYNSNRAKYEQARAQLAVTRNQANYSTLVADHDGVITAVNADVGQVVQPGQPIFRLARQDEPEVLISVPENRLAELKEASAIAVALWANPGKLYAAKIREIAPAVDATTRTFAVRVSIVNPDAAVRWGMTANVALQGAAIATGTMLPLTAIYQKDGAPAVWIYDPASKQVNLRAVQLGPFREDGVLVNTGLRGGEWVVTAGVHKLVPGQTVRPLDNIAKS